MKFAAKLLASLAVILFLGACGHLAPSAPGSLATDALAASPHLLVGCVLAVDAAQGLAFVALTATPPTAALVDDAILIARTDDLRETARLHASRYVRGRTLGVKIISGQPAPGDEVVIRTP